MNMTSQASSRPRRQWLALAIAGLVLAFVIIAVLAVTTGFLLKKISSRPANITQDNSSIAAMLKAPDAKSAVLSSLHGTVEVRTGQGVWAAADTGQKLAAGQSLRTGALSSVDLVFYDGSLTHLGSDAELSVDTLDAAKSGPRVILLTLVQGESEQDVMKSSDPASRFEVNTSSGSGSATGTKFHVLVTPALLSRFWVEEGSVAVTSVKTTVVVVSGQISIITVGQPPSQPFNRLTGEGRILQTGETWDIAGDLFLTNPNTVIVGNPQVGDWAQVLGHELPDGSHLADQIVLLRRATENLVAFSGKVDTISDKAWVIAGRTIQVNATTTIETGLAVGNNVSVVGYVTDVGEIVANHILRMQERSTFEFVGMAQKVSATTWTISGIPVTVNISTTIETGLAAGSLVLANGIITNNGIWVATSITGAKAVSTFEFTGEVKSINPWVVNGTAFDVLDFTEIDEGIQIGSRVQVTGIVRADGTWLAEEIQKLDATPLLHFNFVGQVVSINPWVVGGITLTVNTKTVIKDEIIVGEMVKVEGVIQADKTWLATEIKHTGWHLGQLGCVGTTMVVQSVNGSQVVFTNGETIDLSQNVKVEGELHEASVVLLQSCAIVNGILTPVSIKVLYQLEVLPPETTVPGEGGKVTICHIPPGNPGNQHTITVGQPAVQAHLAHGDTLGPCSSEKPKKQK